jgi:hypothetical protein
MLVVRPSFSLAYTFPCPHLQLLTTTDDVGGKTSEGEADGDQPLFFLDEGPSNEAL